MAIDSKDPFSAAIREPETPKEMLRRIGQLSDQGDLEAQRLMQEIEAQFGDKMKAIVAERKRVRDNLLQGHQGQLMAWAEKIMSKEGKRKKLGQEDMETINRLGLKVNRRHDAVFNRGGEETLIDIEFPDGKGGTMGILNDNKGEISTILIRQN